MLFFPRICFTSAILLLIGFPAAYCSARDCGHLEDPRQARVQGVRRYQTFGFRFLIDALDIVHDDMYYYYFMMGLARWSATGL